MRTSDVCPTCSTYINALCIIFDGPLLETLDIAPLDSVDAALVKIEAWATTVTLSGGANVSDEIFSATWDGNTINAASKNALYDKFLTLDTQITDLQAFALEQTIEVTVSKFSIKTIGDTHVPVPISTAAGEQIIVKNILYVATYTAPAHDTNNLVVGYVGGPDIDTTINTGFTSNVNQYVPVSTYNGLVNTGIEIRGTNSIATGESDITLYITFQKLTL